VADFRDYSLKVWHPAPLPHPQFSMVTSPALHLQFSLCLQLVALQLMLVAGLAEASFTLLVAPFDGRKERQEVWLLDFALSPETSMEDRPQRPEQL